jgi:hypothetical protein
LWLAVEHCLRGSGDVAAEEKLRGHLWDVELDVVLFGLAGEHALCFVAVSFALAIFLVGVLDADVFVHKILAVHVCDRVI